jgi:ABC-type enterochelin transport system permease subunit
VIKREKTSFDRYRLIVRIIGILLGAVPIVSYFVFAFSFDMIQSSYDYYTMQYSVVEDLAYHTSKVSLSLANWTWVYCLPFAFAIGLMDVSVSLYRQYKDS